MPSGALQMDDRNVPAGTETIDIPCALFLSATHNLCLSILLTLSLVPTLQAWFCLRFLSPPPCLLLFLSLFPPVYTWHIGLFPPIFAIHLCLLLGFPSLHFALPVSLYLYPPPCLHSPVSSPSLFNGPCEDCLHSCVFSFRLPRCCPALIGLSQQASHSSIYLVMLCLLVTCTLCSDTGKVKQRWLPVVFTRV